MKKHLLGIVFLLVSIASFAQTGTVHGRIVDAQKLALPSATISIKGTEIGVISDLNGFFSIRNVPVGEQTVVVSYIGYKSQELDVTVVAGKKASIDFKLEAGVEIEEVVVTAQLQGQTKALMQQKNAVNITNVIAADQVGKFPDDNVGDALKRIPGINVEYDQGEARFGHIRGTSPELNSVTLDGQRIPSAESEARAVQLDLIPAEMIQAIEVNKAVTPDMDADAIGGSVNLVTRSAPYGLRVSGSLGTGWNFLRGKPRTQGSVVVAQRLFNNKLGVVISGSVHNNILGSDNLEAVWRKVKDDEVDDTHKEGELYVEEMDVRKYELQRLRQSYSLALDYKLAEGHVIKASAMYNHRNDWENRYRLRYIHEWDGDDAEWKYQVRRQTKAGANDKNARLEDQRVRTLNFGGDHEFDFMKMDWGYSWAMASEDRPNERYASLRNKKLMFSHDLSSLNKPKVVLGEGTDELSSTVGDWSIKEISEENQYTDEKDHSARLNFEIPLKRGDYANTIKLGFRFKDKSKKRENDFFEYEAKDDAGEEAYLADAVKNLRDETKDDYMAGDYKSGSFIKPEYVADYDLESSNLFEKKADLEVLAENYEAKEQVTAGYAMWKQSITSDLSVLVGMRVEHTINEYQGFVYEDIEEGKELTETGRETKSYTNLLPGVHATYKFTPSSNLRFAWTNTLARPKYKDLVPYVNIIEDDKEVAIGNSDLEATSSMNFDLMYEHFFKNIGVVSGGVFYKDVKDFIVDYTNDVDQFGGLEEYKSIQDDFEVTQAINGGDAKVYGFEVAIQRQLDFLPGVLKGFGVYANYTYTGSSADLKLEKRKDEDLELPGTAEHTLNTSISYNHKYVSARISYNFSSDYIDPSEGLGKSTFYDRYYDKSQHLDFNFDVYLNKYFIIYGAVKNITNQPLRYYQGETDRIMQEEYYGLKAKMGVKFNF